MVESGKKKKSVGIASQKLQIVSDLKCCGDITCHSLTSHVFTGICECTDKFWKITGSVNEPKSSYLEMHFLYFFQNLCVKGA